MKKTIFNLSALLLSAILLVGCASKPAGTSEEILEPENENDLCFQVINMSSHEILVWPEITLGNDGVPIKYDQKIIPSGESHTFNLKSKDILDDFDKWMETSAKKYDKDKVFFIAGVKQVDTKEERWTSGYALSLIQNLNQTAFVYDDLTNRPIWKSQFLSEATVYPDCNYTFKNNTNEAVYVSNTIYSEANERIAVSEKKFLLPGKEVTFSYNINTLRKKYPNCYMGIEYIGQYSTDFYISGWFRNFNSLTDKMIYSINNHNEPNDNTLQTSTDTTTDEWKTSTWFSPGDKNYKSVDGKKVKFSEKSSDNDGKSYSNYFTDKVNGFEAEVTKFSGDEVGSGGYGFTFCEDLNKGKAYLLTITTVGLFRIWEINNGQWKSLIPADEDGRTFRVSSALNCAYGVKDKVTVKRAGKDIQIFFNDELAWIIQDAKLPAGNTRFFASHNGNANETTEIDFEYLKFQK